MIDLVSIPVTHKSHDLSHDLVLYTICLRRINLARLELGAAILRKGY